MEDLKTLTVKYLRDLARKHLGKGHSKLKTREELLAALKEFLPASLKTASAISAVSAVEKAAVAAASPPATEEGDDSEDEELDIEAKAPPRAAEPLQHDAEPLVEGFFVARVQGAEEARRHRMTDDQGRHAVETRSKPVYDEQLGELPASYEDDTAIALPKDPNTVFFAWDFGEATRRSAFEGLRDGKAVLRVFDGETLVREVDFALESRSFYVNGLTPGRRYRLEAHAVGRDGASRRVGPSTNLVALPNEGPSSDTSVRLLRAPWTLPVRRMLEAIRAGEAQVREEHDEVRSYLDVEEWEELANSASHLKRRVTERSELIPGRKPSDVPARQRMFGASDRHMGASGNWPSGKK